MLGVAFKPDVDDPRNSPAERVIELLLARGAEVRYHDPYIPRFTVGGDVFYRPNCTLESVPLTDEELASADCVVIVTGHHSVDYAGGPGGAAGRGLLQRHPGDATRPAHRPSGRSLSQVNPMKATPILTVEGRRTQRKQGVKPCVLCVLCS